MMICLLPFTLLAIPGCQGGDNPEPASAAVLPVTDSDGTKLVSLFFDDAFLNQYEVGLPVLVEHDFRATFGAITGYIGTGHDLWEYMDEPHLKILANCDMDIASHTRTHPHMTANLTDEQLRSEIIDSKRDLEKMGFKVRTMIYPYYEWNDKIIGYVKEAGYTCARAGWSHERACRFKSAGESGRYHAFSWQITNQNMDKFKSYLKEAGPDALVGLTYHFIADDGPAETSTPVANFMEQMAYLDEAGFTVVPLPEIFE